ncbi:MAG: PhoH family protein [Micrococcales bacterium]|nr:PhoH family protein [Actinomycetota bacterium]NCA08100.1 PhoH family protein [Micrococcales bacterium]
MPNSSSAKDTKLEFAITEVNPLAVFGTEDQLLKTIEAEHPTVSVLVRGNQVSITGTEDECFAAKKLIDEAIKLVQAGLNVAPADISRSAQMIQQSQSPTQMLSQSILSNRGKSIRPKTTNQKNYVDAIDENTIVFGIGPAGTGKTYLAMAKAVQALQRKEVSRIILTRPAVEAGERLGFLPGTLTDKIDPYLRPLFDALHEMLDPDSVPKLMATGTIEVAPLAYMRGRTLNDSFIILDEAQNTTPEQMKMFLTRLGFNSKMVVTGDVTQIDLPMGNSGLKVASSILTDVQDLAFCQLDSSDVVRHSLVGRIVDAYSKFEAKKLKAK